MEFLEFANHLWGATKPTIVLTDYKSDTRFFRTKAIPSCVRNACDYVLQFIFKIAHIAGSVNAAASFLSRLQAKVTVEFRLKIQEDIKTTPLEVKTSSSEVAKEKKFFFTQTDDEKETEEQTFEHKSQCKRNKTAKVGNEAPPSMKPSFEEFTRIDGNSMSYSINAIKANSRIRVEQDVDLVLNNLKLKLLRKQHDKVLLTSNSRFEHCKSNEDCIMLKYGLQIRSYCGETGRVKYYHFFIPKQLVDEVLWSQHGEFR